jgi:putative PIN family toxin of toxin-antitoxin system
VTVVLDSGVWVSALHFGGTPRLALEKALAVDKIAICDQLVAEIVRVLVGKLDWEPRRLSQSLNFYLQDVVHIKVRGILTGVCRDSNDDFILECAAVANARLIISGDRDLGALHRYRNIRIITPRQYTFARWPK